jgi:hypothetical protein
VPRARPDSRCASTSAEPTELRRRICTSPFDAHEPGYQRIELAIWLVDACVQAQTYRSDLLATDRDRGGLVPAADRRRRARARAAGGLVRGLERLTAR